MMTNWTDERMNRRNEFYETVEKYEPIGPSKLQDKLGLGDGVFYRTKRDALEVFPNLKWDKTQFSINKQTKLESAISNDWEVEL